MLGYLSRVRPRRVQSKLNPPEWDEDVYSTMIPFIPSHASSVAPLLSFYGPPMLHLLYACRIAHDLERHI